MIVCSDAIRITYGKVHAMHKSRNIFFPEHFQAFIQGSRDFPKGLPTTSLQILQVSEAESQSITSYERFQVTCVILLSVHKASTSSRQDGSSAGQAV